MSLPAHLEPMLDETHNQRTAVRRKLTLGSTLTDRQTEAMIHNLSSTGLLIETPADLGGEESFEVQLPEAGARRATVVWSSGQFFGCRFQQPVPPAAISAAMLRSEFDSGPQPRSLVDAQRAFALFETLPAGEEWASERRRAGLGTAIAVLLLAALTYAVLTAGLATIAVIGVAMVVLSALMIATLVWTQNHVLL